MHYEVFVYIPLCFGDLGSNHTHCRPRSSAYLSTVRGGTVCNSGSILYWILSQMKMPRTIKIFRLMAHILRAFLQNRSLGLQGSLAELDELGGIYIKFLQMVVLSSAGLQQMNFAQLLKVYEDSKPDDIVAWKHLQRIGMPHMHRVAKMDPLPFATGSFGQVYRAQLDTGEEVVIKILRPSVARYLRYDLRLLFLLSRVYSIVDKQRMLDFMQIYKQFKTTCLQEVRYKHEVEVAQLYYETYRNHPQLVIPKTFSEMCTDQVIVQEYIAGVSVAKLLNMKQQGINPRQYVREQLSSDLHSQLEIIGIELLSKALVGDILQADPHPGNIIVLGNNKVALIDFGMATELSENRVAFYEMLLQYQAYYSNSFHIEELALAALKYLSPKLFSAITGAEQLLGNSFLEKEKLLERLKRITFEVADEQGTKTMITSMLEQNLIMRVLFFVVNHNNRFGFTFDIKSVNLLKASQGYLTLLGQFDDNAVVVARVINGAVEYAQKNLDRVIDTQGVQLKPQESLELLSTWLDKMSRNDPWLTNRLVGGYIE